jgi:protein-tyrosine phosphatase
MTRAGSPLARVEHVDARWIELDGAANTRDLGGLPTGDGRSVQPGRLIRSDNLQGLSPRDVQVLIEDHNVRAVADLRTGVEVRSEGPGPLTEVDDVEIRHLSLFPEAGEQTDAAAAEDAPVILPWQNRGRTEKNGYQGATAVYLSYLDDRADSVIEALRMIAYSPGATIVHCAAGKDRTGTVIALALTEVGVTREAIVADYVRSGERIGGIFARLRSSPTYEADLAGSEADRHAPTPATMQRLLEAIDAEFGGVRAWLRAHGWTEADAAALRQKLLD